MAPANMTGPDYGSGQPRGLACATVEGDDRADQWRQPQCPPQHAAELGALPPSPATAGLAAAKSEISRTVFSAPQSGQGGAGAFIGTNRSNTRWQLGQRYS